MVLTSSTDLKFSLFAGQQAVLLDVLEAPQLMDTCVHIGFKAIGDLALSIHVCARAHWLDVCAGQQGVLLHVLEAPQLMDTCVRSGNHADALDLPCSDSEQQRRIQAACSIQAAPTC